MENNLTQTKNIITKTESLINDFNFQINDCAVPETKIIDEQNKKQHPISRIDAKMLIKTLKTGTNPDCRLVGKLYVGTSPVLSTIQDEIDCVTYGSSSARFICGEYGTGKTFNLKLCGAAALEKNMAISHVILDKDRAMQKIHEIYTEIVKNLKTNDCKSFLEMLDKWIEKLIAAAKTNSIVANNYKDYLIQTLRMNLKNIEETSGVFAIALANYIQAKINGNNEYLTHAIAWISGEHNLSAAAKRNLGIRGEVDKTNGLSFLKGLLKLIKLMDYSGTLILFDECEHTRQITRANSRNGAYQNIREIVDLSADNSFDSTLFIFAGNSEWYNDADRGIQSYQALNDRISSRMKGKYKNNRTPIITLQNIDPAGLEILMERICLIYNTAFNYDAMKKVKPVMSQLIEFYRESNGLTGGRVHPRTFVKTFVELLEILEQNPEIKDASEIIEIFSDHAEESDSQFDENEKLKEEF